ncbi:PIR protein [Plasmodium ovale]|uniref:PIR protein n=1 Tax=Plasmodium ovale TaxID=36330 RepID=A0A1D3JD83_PLAOA|nr:PIR protein [Plasmodium ovale]
MTLFEKLHTLNEFAEADTSLKDSDLYNLYNYHFQSECKDDVETENFCQVKQNHKFEDTQVENFYNKMIVNLKKILVKEKYFQDIDNNQIKLCTYMKYWIYDQIISKGFIDSQLIKLFNAWNSEINVFRTNSPCELYVMNLRQIKEIKPLFDYFILYDRNEKKKIASDKILLTQYCKYFKNSHYLYSFKDVQCTNSEISPLCKEFNQYLKKFIDYNEDVSFSCDDETQINVDSSHPDSSSWKPPIVQWYDDIQRGPVNQDSNSAYTTNTEHKGNIIPVFTPLRSLILPKIQKIKNILAYKKEQKYKTFLSQYESENENFDNIIYNISYNST